MRLFAIALTTLFILSAMGCGGDDDDDAATSSPSAALTATAHATTVEPTPTDTSGYAPGVLIDGYIGTATMFEDGTITLRLRAELPNGGIGEGTFAYAPDDPRYQGILDHIGAIEPGQTVNVLPFPE